VHILGGSKPNARQVHSITPLVVALAMCLKFHVTEYSIPDDSSKVDDLSPKSAVNKDMLSQEFALSGCKQMFSQSQPNRAKSLTEEERNMYNDGVSCSPYRGGCRRKGGSKSVGNRLRDSRDANNGC
jgi:hypothetical protein